METRGKTQQWVTETEEQAPLGDPYEMLWVNLSLYVPLLLQPEHPSVGDQDMDPEHGRTHSFSQIKSPVLRS